MIFHPAGTIETDLNQSFLRDVRTSRTPLPQARTPGRWIILFLRDEGHGTHFPLLDTNKIWVLSEHAGERPCLFRSRRRMRWIHDD